MEFPSATRCTCKTAYVQHYLNCCKIFVIWSWKLIFGHKRGLRLKSTQLKKISDLTSISTLPSRRSLEKLILCVITKKTIYYSITKMTFRQVLCTGLLHEVFTCCSQVLEVVGKRCGVSILRFSYSRHIQNWRNSENALEWHHRNVRNTCQIANLFQLSKLQP